MNTDLHFLCHAQASVTLGLSNLQFSPTIQGFMVHQCDCFKFNVSRMLELCSLALPSPNQLLLPVNKLARKVRRPFWKAYHSVYHRKLPGNFSEERACRSGDWLFNYKALHYHKQGQRDGSTRCSKGGRTTLDEWVKSELPTWGGSKALFAHARQTECIMQLGACMLGACAYAGGSTNGTRREACVRCWVHAQHVCKHLCICMHLCTHVKLTGLGGEDGSLWVYGATHWPADLLANFQACRVLLT